MNFNNYIQLQEEVKIYIDVIQGYRRQLKEIFIYIPS